MTPEDDLWVVSVDMGAFDLIVVESGSLVTCESYKAVNQQLYREQLQIGLKSELRLLREVWNTVEVCVSSTVREPEKVRS